MLKEEADNSIYLKKPKPGEGLSGLSMSQNIQELVNAERLYYKLANDFRIASVYACHCIIKKNPTPLNLFNLVGDEGEKYVVGGIYVRRA